MPARPRPTRPAVLGMGVVAAEPPEGGQRAEPGALDDGGRGCRAGLVHVVTDQLRTRCAPVSLTATRLRPGHGCGEWPERLVPRRCNRRSGQVPKMPAKPSAQPTLVRTQHLPPAGIQAHGRYGVSEPVWACAARCHRKRLPAAGRGIYEGWHPPGLAWSRRTWGCRCHRSGHRDLAHHAAWSAASIRLLATASPSSRHLA